MCNYSRGSGGTFCRWELESVSFRPLYAYLGNGFASQPEAGRMELLFLLQWALCGRGGYVHILLRTLISTRWKHISKRKTSIVLSLEQSLEFKLAFEKIAFLSSCLKSWRRTKGHNKDQVLLFLESPDQITLSLWIDPYPQRRIIFFTELWTIALCTPLIKADISWLLTYLCFLIDWEFLRANDQESLWQMGSRGADFWWTDLEVELYFIQPCIPNRHRADAP